MESSAIRAILGALRWCSACVMQSEARLVPLAIKMEYIVVCRVAKILHRGNETSRGQPTPAWPPTSSPTWRDGWPWQSREPDVPAHTFRVPPPWDPPVAEFSVTSLPASKALLTPQELRQRSLMAMKEVIEPGSGPLH